MSGWEWFWILIPIALLVFAGIVGPNKIRGKKWRGETKPSTMMGPERPDPPADTDLLAALQMPSEEGELRGLEGPARH